MTTWEHLRTYALALPETEEGTHFGMVAFSVRGKGFASVTKDGQVQLNLPDDETEAALAAHPAGERITRAGKTIGFRVPPAGIDDDALNALVRVAWSCRAPRRLAAQLAASEAASGATPEPPSEAVSEAASGEGRCDLPAGIGRPATRALLGAGLATLDDVARHTADELLALHGVGPKAVRVLTEALQRQGRSLRG